MSWGWGGGVGCRVTKTKNTEKMGMDTLNQYSEEAKTINCGILDRNLR
jgi:hypothetical protein